MSGMADWQAKISINIDDLKKRIKVAEGELDKVTKEDRKIKLDFDTKTLESAIQKLDKMLDSLGKGTGDFKQFENLSKELSAITSEVKDFSKAFGKLDDSGAKTLLSSIQNIDKSLSELSQHILNVNKNMGTMGNNTSGVVKQVENIGNAATDAVKQVDKLADTQSKLGGNKTNISLGDTSVINSELQAKIDTIKKEKELLSKIRDDNDLGDYGKENSRSEKSYNETINSIKSMNASYEEVLVTVTKIRDLQKEQHDLYGQMNGLDPFSDERANLKSTYDEKSKAIRELESTLPILELFQDETDKVINRSTTNEGLSEFAKDFVQYISQAKLELGQMNDVDFASVIQSTSKIEEPLKEVKASAESATKELQKLGDVYRAVRSQDLEFLDSHQKNGAIWATSQKDLYNTLYTGGNEGKSYSAEYYARNPLVFDAKGQQFGSVTYLGDGSDEASRKITELYNKVQELTAARDEAYNSIGKESQEYIELSKQLGLAKTQYDELSKSKKNVYGTHFTDEYVDLAKANGYDGLRIDNIYDSTGQLSSSFAVWSQDQIKNIQLMASGEKELLAIHNQMKDAFPNADSTASVEKIADGFKEVKQNTEQATKVTEKYQRVLSQVGELGVDAKVSAMYQRNDGQLESVSWKAKRDDQGQILYDKNGNIDYDFNSTVISKYEQLEKIITTADNKLRDLQKSLKDTQNLNSNASTKNIEEQIQYQKDYIQLLEQTVKAISQQDEYLLYEQQIIDARAKAEKEYNLNQGTKSDISNAKQLASDEEKRQKSIEQTNRLLNKQQIIIDGIEKSYSKAANNDLDKAVNSQSDLAELANKKAEIQKLINQLTDQDRNSLNEDDFLLLEKYIAEYKQLAKDKLKANNPSKQELGGQELDVLLANQVTQYNKLISQSEKYGDATKEITNELKAQRDLIAEQDKNDVYVARSKKADGSELTANDYYNARDNYKIDKSIFSSYETDIKSASNMAKQEASNIQAEWDKNIKAIQDYMDAMTKLNNLKAKDKGTGSEANQIALQTQNVEELKKTAFEARQNLSSMQAENPDVIAWKQWVDMMELFVQASKGSAESAAKLKDVLDNIKAPSLDKYENKLASYQTKKAGYDATIARFKDGGWTSDEYLKNVQAVKDAVKKYEDLLSNIKAKGGITSEEDVQKLKEYESEIKKTISTVTNMSAAEKGYNFVSAQKELDKIHKLLAENSKMSSEAKAKIQAYYREIESGNPSMSLDKIHGEILKIYNAEVEAGRAGRSFFDTLKNSGFHQLAAQMAGMFGFYDVINLGKEGLSIVRELNTALTEMRKVSDESLQSLKNYQNTTFDVADAVGTTAKQIQASTADYMRLGESLDEAAESAKTANVLLNVSEFDNIEDATKSLVAMGQAYKDLDKMTIVDKLNEVGNNYAISTDELATALQKSAATLSLMGNTIDEAASLVTTANATIQDADSVSAGLRTISLRLVGTEEAEEELSAMNEEVDAFVKATNSKKQQIIKDYTAVASNNYQGFDILDSNGNYKNTYEILLGIAKVYKEIQEQDKKLGTNHATALIEELAGKNRSNIASAILQDPTQLEAVKKSSEEALGSAKNELNSYLDSIDGKMAQLENRAQEFWFKVIDSETIKNGIGLLSTLLKGATDFVDTVGLLPTILAPIAAILGKGKSIQRFCPVW